MQKQNIFLPIITTRVVHRIIVSKKKFITIVFVPFHQFVLTQQRDIVFFFFLFFFFYETLDWRRRHFSKTKAVQICRNFTRIKSREFLQFESKEPAETISVLEKAARRRGGEAARRPPLSPPNNQPVGRYYGDFRGSTRITRLLTFEIA